MGKKKKADAEPRDPKPPEGFQAPAAAQPASSTPPVTAATTGLDPEDDKLFRKAIRKAGEKLKEKERALIHAKTALRDAKAQCEEARCALEKLANEELPLFERKAKKPKAAPAPTTTVATSDTKPLPFGGQTTEEPAEPPKKRGRPKKQPAESAA
jgi:hypothetical protein